MCGAVFPPCFLFWDQTHASTRDSWTLTGKSESVSCGDTAPFSWFLCPPGFVCALQKSVVLVLLKSVIKPHWPPQSNSLVVLSPFVGLWVVKSVVGLRTFLTVWEFLWYNFSAVFGSSAPVLWWVMLCDPSLLQPEPLSLQQATADLCFHRRHFITQKQVWLSFCGHRVSVCTDFCLSLPNVSGKYEVWF